MVKSRGLPDTKQMRHDAHFVDRLSARPSTSVGRLIPVAEIDPNPHQPRRAFDGISDLVASIQEKGVLEPLLVRQVGERFEIIAGERRFRAAQEAGLSQVPCIEIDVDDRGCLEISLVENLQRRDLTAFEEADALQQLKERFSFTHEEIARKLSRSRTSVTEALSLASLPTPIRRLCDMAGITARTTLLQIARLTDEKDMAAMIATIEAGNLNRDDVRRLRTEPVEDDAEPQPPGQGSSQRGFTFRVRLADRPYSFTLRFPERQDVPKRELIKTLQQIIDDLRTQR